MSTADKPSIPPKDENTVPPKLISGYNDIIKSLVDYTPTGKLSYTWPKSIDQVPININDYREPLFPYGFGLTY